jgi:hypothetical protein
VCKQSETSLGDAMGGEGSSDKWDH